MKSKDASKLVLALNILVFLFYLSALVLFRDVYQFALVGALFEMSSIPMLLLLGGIPLYCIVQLIQSKGNIKRHVLASALLITATIVILVKSNELFNDNL